MIGPVTRLIALIALVLQFLWPRYLFFQVAGKGVSGFTLIAVALLASALASFAIRHRFRQNVLAGLMRGKLLVGAFVGLWLWRLFCDLAVGAGGQAAFGTFLDFIYLGSWFISGVIIFADGRLRSALPYAIFFSVILATFFGLLEYQMGTPIARLLGLGNMSLELNQFTMDLNRGGMMRVRSLFTHPIVYGQFMGAMAPFALFLIFSRKLRDKFLGVMMAVAIGVSLVLCNARSPLVVTIVGIVCFMAFYLFDLRRRVRLFFAVFGLAFAVAGTPVALTVLGQYQSGRSSEEANSSAARSIQMDRGLTALRESPIIGYGAGSAGEYAATIGGIGGRSSVDNYYLTVAVESGYVGLTFFILLLVAMGRQGIRAIYTTPWDRERSLNCAALGTIFAFASGLTVISISDALSIMFQMAGFLVAATGVPAIVRREGRTARGRAAVPDTPAVPA